VVPVLAYAEPVGGLSGDAAAVAVAQAPEWALSAAVLPLDAFSCRASRLRARL